MRGTSLPRRSLCGAAGAAVLTASGAIHLDLYLTGYRTIPTIGWLFLLQVITAFALALAILLTFWTSGPMAPLTAGAGALFAVATLGGYLLSIWAGLFGFREVRTTAGIVAGLLDVAAFVFLAALVVLGTGLRIPGIPAVPAVMLVSVAALALLGAGAATAQSGSGPATAAPGQELRTGTVDGVPVVTDNKGLTLYWFAPDTATSSKCTGSCAVYWPPVYGRPAAGPGVTGAVGSITRPDGTTQATYDGHPLYTYVSDSTPGQASGNNLDLNGGVWHEVTVSG
jgi:predicted lipoprotein with Yx(FWY)xxD motif